MRQVLEESESVSFSTIGSPARSRKLTSEGHNDLLRARYVELKHMAAACNPRTSVWVLLRLLAVTLMIGLPGSTGLSPSYYSSSCPDLESTVGPVFLSQLQSDGRVGASIVRMHFHDCFVQGCDASNLLDDTATFTGEKTAAPNSNSLRGFSAIDAIKSAVESACPQTVSCADILALVVRDAVVEAGGPAWTVEYGRLDSVTASLVLANTNLPSPNSNAATLTASFNRQGLSQLDMVALSGAHTFGKVKCGTINSRLYNWQGSGAPDPSLNKSYLATLQAECPNAASSSDTVVNLDKSTGTVFDKNYYTNLQTNEGTLFSDQSLLTDGGSTNSTVFSFASSQSQFFAQFVISIVKMGRIAPLPGSTGEVRVNCHKTN